MEYFPGLDIANIDQRKQDMKIKDLLAMSAGVQWSITDDISSQQMIQTQNWTKFFLDQPMQYEPGSTFMYCNGAAQALGSILQKTTGKQPADFLTEKLNTVVGNTYWYLSPENVNSGQDGIYMQPDRMARFGYLYLKNGNWIGRQLVPAQWVEESTKPQIKTDWGPVFSQYGYFWWIPRFGGYAAMGRGGQYIFVIPDLNMVAVFTSGLFKGSDFFYPGELMENYILPSVKSQSPLANNTAASEKFQKAVDAVQKAPCPKLPG